MRLKYILFFLLMVPVAFSDGFAEAVFKDKTLLEQMEEEIIGVVEKASPAVVSIEAESAPPAFRKGLKDDEWPDWVKEFMQSDFISRRRRGTGFIIDPGGYILTTEHVVDGSARVTVTHGPGRQFPGRVVGIDRMLNLALLKIEGDDLPFISLENAAEARIGSWVITLGQPFGMATSPSWGIVSGLSRCGLGIAPYEDLIQLTAPVNPGDSGGPVLNCRGEITGIIAGSFAGYREMEFDWDFMRRFQERFSNIRSGFSGDFFQPSQAQGVSFAIPARLAQKAVKFLKEEGSSSRGWMGIHIGEPESADSGVPIIAIMPDSPAARAGLREGDLILAVDDSPIVSVRNLQETIIFCPLDRPVSLKIKRAGEILTLPLTVGRPPGK